MSSGRMEMASYDCLDWLLSHQYCAQRSNLQNSQNRRAGKLYRLKKQLVKKVWLVASAFMLVNPSLPIIVTTLLFTAFLSFSILDET